MPLKKTILNSKMKIIKRDGRIEDVFFDKVGSRLQRLCYNLNDQVDITKISQNVISQIYDKISTTQIDELASQISFQYNTIHPHYGVLAARIAISNLQKNTKKHFSDVILDLFKNNLISKNLFDTVQKNKDKINSSIIYQRDFNLTYFGFKTLEKSYLIKIKNIVQERPQHLFMRVALGIHGENIDKAIETYSLMSDLYFTHATPTLFNAGTPQPQLSSCFLLGTNDSIEAITKTWSDCSQISKWAGGIGLHISNIRCKGSLIRGTNGNSNGILPMLKVYNALANYVNQGGKRPGSIAVYIEPWHGDIYQFIDARKSHGAEDERARDLFYALWIPDLFMKRVKEEGDWCLMCPDECPGLGDVYGDEFEKLYQKYENEGKYKKKIKALDLWLAIIDAQIETGTPYICYKDNVNNKSNQSNVGIIRSSNLCTEIMEYSDDKEYAVCNLASIGLPKFVEYDEDKKPYYNYKKLNDITQIITENLNKIIDINFYPVPETKKSNLRHRPIGIGVQGLADVYILMRVAFDSPEAEMINKNIFETIYYASLQKSNELATTLGTYDSYEGSPISKGILQFDMWNIKPESGLWNWEELRESIKKNGVRNSLLIAPMPTASTSQILGNNECIEPFTSNLYTRKTSAGEFVMINKHLIKDLIELELWNEDMKNKIVFNNGSIQKIFGIPEDIKNIYKTVWEIKQKKILDQAIGRGPYIDQSQSLNIHIANPNRNMLSSMHFYGWKGGLKTGSYYLRTKAASQAKQFSLNAEDVKRYEKENEDCLMCGS